MNQIFKWIMISTLGIASAGFIAFLWYIPPFMTTPPEEFIEMTLSAAPSLDHIEDPALRLLAEKGKYIITTGDCIECHVPNGSRGPNFDEYLAGGMKWVTPMGSFVSRNLTPDPETGLGRQSDDEIKQALRSGVRSDGRLMHPLIMPWILTTTLSEEELHAVMVYLRNIIPVYHKIPDPDPNETSEIPLMIMGDFGGHQQL